MIYLKEFDTHASYEEKLNGGWVDFKIPNVSYCNDVNDVHFNPYNLIEFYVSEITGTTPQTVSIYTDNTHHEDVTVSEDNKWYSYVLPKDKGMYRIEGDSVKKVVVVKADINFIGSTNYPGNTFIPKTTVEASFNGINTSYVINMGSMFAYCGNLTSLDLSSFNTSIVTSMGYMFYYCNSLESLILNGWDMSKVTNTHQMFDYCNALNTIKMVGCSEETITKIEEALTAAKIKDKVTIKTT